jgi:hypothetical protein
LGGAYGDIDFWKEGLKGQFWRRRRENKCFKKRIYTRG